MELLHRRCCGLDVHKETVVACLRLVADGEVTTEVRTFQTTTADLLRLSEWLAANECSHVAMDATGVYWKPVWHILDDGEFALVLANGRVYLYGAYFPRACARGAPTRRARSGPTRAKTDPLAPPAGRRRYFQNSGWGLVRPPRRRIRWCGRRRRASAARYGVIAKHAALKLRQLRAAAPDSMVWSAAPGERSEVRGHRQTRGIETPAVEGCARSRSSCRA
jgi:hypothetical protein